MQRYFIDPSLFGEDTVQIVGDDAYHLCKVMRMKPGDKVLVCDGLAKEALVRLSTVTNEQAEAEIVELRQLVQEPRWSVAVAQSLPKGDKMELIIQKGTEIGASRFAPFQSERIIVQYDAKKEAKRLERWGKIAKEAAEQAHRGRVPAVEPVRTWRQMMEIIPSFDLALFCYEKQNGQEDTGLRTVLQRFNTNQKADSVVQPFRILLMIGPEGGFSEREAEEAEACGACIIGLGQRILRTETASIAALACLMYESGEMGGV
ncbi:16S rRNA (uracil(1498)-N(3))-methyltransferase [Paenibacillaceae bacterium]|nr:16S rRNA (uracil(1498)-N(3))-methyltransferase [Paenibacillaceae bacterium]